MDVTINPVHHGMYHICGTYFQWLMPSEGGYLEAEGPVEKTWRIKQQDIGQAVDISSARNQYDVVLPGLHLAFDWFSVIISVED